jgi:hypothetical protein
MHSWGEGALVTVTPMRGPSAHPVRHDQTRIEAKKSPPDTTFGGLFSLKRMRRL